MMYSIGICRNYS